VSGELCDEVMISDLMEKSERGERERRGKCIEG
jgi:hypothetical protein